MHHDYLHELFSLDGQTAVVIGGAGVLGFALAKGLARAGAHVVLANSKVESCQKRAEELVKHGLQAEALQVDVSKRASIEKLLETVVARTGRADVLVNCAGVNVGSKFLDANDDDWDRIMAVNLRAVFQACQIFGAHMVAAGGGSIINIGSVTSHLPLSRVFAYSASKAAVLNLTRNVAREFGETGVRVNAICPGFFPAEQNRKLLDQERIDNIMRGTPMKRFGEPDELIGALLLLASSKAGKFITGTHINVDGGFTAAWF
jgi:NAD(P)-dependent dehydrogenase (short-subunit alcohol dehydrogenase family)